MGGLDDAAAAMLPSPAYRDDLVELYNTDCLQVLPHLTADTFDVMVTDPPYGIALAGSKNGMFKRWGRPGQMLEGDEDTELGQAVINHVRDRLNRPVAAFASPKAPWAGPWRSLLAWDKGPAVGCGGDMRRCWKQTWELIQVGANGPLNGKRHSGVITCWTTSHNYRYHPTQKPLRLLAYLIDKLTQPGDVILDPFAGSGTTLVAARLLGRRADGLEVDKTFCAAAAARLSGQIAEPPEKTPAPWPVPLPEL